MPGQGGRLFCAVVKAGTELLNDSGGMSCKCPSGVFNRGEDAVEQRADLGVLAHGWPACQSWTNCNWIGKGVQWFIGIARRRGTDSDDRSLLATRNGEP